MKIIACHLLVAIWCTANGFHQVPSHASNGKLYRLLQQHRNDSYVETRYFHQQLDHFNVTNTNTFLQRYYIDDQYWSHPNGPILLYIGGESPLEKIPGGFIDVIAENVGAKIVALEHRFYGKSIPYQDLSTSNLKYLQVEQALADLAYFRESYQVKLRHENQWIAVGGSYPGALSAWFRIVYPEATIGALASSAVVNSIYNYTAFDEQVSKAIGPKCTSVVQECTQLMENALKTNATEVKQMFGAQNLSDPDFLYMVADAAAMSVQYGHKDKLCNPLLQAAQTKKPLIQAFADFVNTYYGESFGSGCFYDTNCLQNQPSRWETGRSWRWQKCAQVAFFQVAPLKNSLRSSMVNLTYHENQCQAIFGDVVNPKRGSALLNERYGGKNPAGHRIFFSNFADDPWQTASVLTSVASDEPAVYANCDYCGHCGDLSSNLSVPVPIQSQRTHFLSYLIRWLNEPELTMTAQLQKDEPVSWFILLPLFVVFGSIKILLHGARPSDTFGQKRLL